VIGITLGDGNLGKYPRCQYLRIYCNLEQKQYAREVERILIEVFGKKPYWRIIEERNVLYLEISKKGLGNFLGLKTGSKKANQVRIPAWIFESSDTLAVCLRGLFDTDGCCYVTGGKYKIVNFRSVIKPLLDDIYRGLQVLGFNPYRRENAVELGRQAEVAEFFKIVKPLNRRHYRHDRLG